MENAGTWRLDNADRTAANQCSQVLPDNGKGDAAAMVQMDTVDTAAWRAEGVFSCCEFRKGGRTGGPFTRLS